jgi:acetyl-CoA carboxylase biotin carboxyl carrier protein
MRLADVKRLMDAMAAADVTELELEQRDGEGAPVYRVALKRGSAPTAAAPASTTPGASAALEPDRAPAPAAAPAATTEPASHLVDVTAPIVGTFYSAPAPDAPPYVKVGTRVQPGAVLCIIEAMKLMNEIEAEVAGTIAEVHVANEDPVEYGQVLFRIDPS